MATLSLTRSERKEVSGEMREGQNKWVDPESQVVSMVLNL